MPHAGVESQKFTGMCLPSAANIIAVVVYLQVQCEYIATLTRI